MSDSSFNLTPTAHHPSQQARTYPSRRKPNLPRCPAFPTTCRSRPSTTNTNPCHVLAGPMIPSSKRLPIPAPPFYGPKPACKCRRWPKIPLSLSLSSFWHPSYDHQTTRAAEPKSSPQGRRGDDPMTPEPQFTCAVKAPISPVSSTCSKTGAWC